MSVVTPKRRQSTMRRAARIYARKRARKVKYRSNGRLTSKPLTVRQRQGYRKLAMRGFYKKISKLRESLKLPLSILEGTLTHPAAVLDLIFSESVDAELTDYMKDFAATDPAYTATDTGLCALQFETWLGESEATTVAAKFVETIVEEGADTFLVIVDGKLDEDDLEAIREAEIVTLEALVEAGAVDQETDEVADLSVYEATPIRATDDDADAAVQEPSGVTFDYQEAKEGVSLDVARELFPEAVAKMEPGAMVFTDPHGVQWKLSGERFVPITEGTDAKTFGNEVHRQLGPKTLFMIGAKHPGFGVDNETKRPYYTVQIGRNPKRVSFIRIEQDAGDTYKMVFVRYRAGKFTTLATESGVTVDQLHALIRTHTGLETSLGTMGKVSEDVVDEAHPYAAVVKQTLNTSYALAKEHGAKMAHGPIRQEVGVLHGDATGFKTEEDAEKFAKAFSGKFPKARVTRLGSRVMTAVDVSGKVQESTAEDASVFERWFYHREDDGVVLAFGEGAIYTLAPEHHAQVEKIIRAHEATSGDLDLDDVFRTRKLLEYAKQHGTLCEGDVGWRVPKIHMARARVASLRDRVKKTNDPATLARLRYAELHLRQAMREADEGDDDFDVEMKKAAGGVVVDKQGRVLIRAPTNGYGGYAWTWPKGRVDAGESEKEAAIREVKEETGVTAKIVTKLGEYGGMTTVTAFYLMTPVSISPEHDAETAEVLWVEPAEAFEHLMLTKYIAGRNRDLKVLRDALKAMKARGMVEDMDEAKKVSRDKLIKLLVAKTSGDDTLDG